MGTKMHMKFCYFIINFSGNEELDSFYPLYIYLLENLLYVPLAAGSSRLVLNIF